MIDTDKYEGYTDYSTWMINSHEQDESKWICHPKTWWMDTYEGPRRVLEHHKITKLSDFVKDEDAQLIADAPLLLAEVNRLREGIKEALEYLTNEVGGAEQAAIDTLRELIE